MKKLMLLLIIVIIGFGCTKVDKNIFDTKDAYFGLKPPGLIPEVFAPGIVSDSTWAEHCQVAFSPAGDEIYWSAWSSKYPPVDTAYGRNSEQIYFSKLENGKWTKPAVAEFLKEHLGYLNGGPSFTPDGNRLYFYSNRPGGVGAKDVWYVDRTENGWGKTFNGGEQINTADGDWTPYFSKDGTAYSMGNRYYNEKEKPLRFKYSDGRFSAPDSMLIHPDFNPYFAIYVSPGETYVIFSASKKEGFGSLDLYVSFKDDKGQWGTPINMGDKINTEKAERFPVVSPDGKYFFFMRHTPGQDIFWVSSKIIDELKK